MRKYFVYMLECADGSYYVGISNDPDRRLWEHNAGIDETCYTFERRPVRIVHSSCFNEVFDAIRWEKQLKGWSRAKKRVVIRDDWREVQAIVRAERRAREAKKRR